MKKLIGFVLAMTVAVGFSAAVVTASARTAKPVVVTVTMTDFHFKLSKAKGYKHGVAYTFKVVNKGAAPHNFDIQRVKATKILAPGKSAHFTVTFKKAGSYQYLCDVPRHAELGMAGTMKVA
jgi:uncharacterized cupredoxin-like copper-binding protein